MMDMDEEGGYDLTSRGFKHGGLVGTPLAEVFSVFIKTEDNDDCQVYGTIEVTDCNGTFLIYNKKREDSEIITNNRSLRLINEERAISGYDHFTVCFNLKDKQNGDDVLVNNSFKWNESMGYDKGLCAKVGGEHGLAKATMYYTVYEVAIEANIWIHFTQNEGTSRDIVHASSGSVITRYKKRYDWPKAEIEKEYNEITLFESRSFDLEHEDLIQVSRSIVVMPVFASLSILVDIKLCEDEESLWCIEAEFFPDLIVNTPPRSVEFKGEYGVLVVYALGCCYQTSFEFVSRLKKGWREFGAMP